MNNRAKGASGEREFCKWMENNLKLDHRPTRNLEQVRGGGSDIIDVYPFCVEVKRREVLDLQSWWIQVKHDAKKLGDDAIPIVAFRQNRKPWEFLISSGYIGLEIGFIRLTEKTFIDWADNALNSYLLQSKDIL